MDRRLVSSVLGVALFSVAAAPSSSLATDPTVTLRLAIVGGEDRPMAPYARSFVSEANQRSRGTIVIDPVWASGVAATGFEAGVAQQLVDGSADLALVASRGWDAAGVTSLQALEAPFLITDDATAVAVSTDRIADDLLAGMADGNVTGLAFWPEDLVHFVQMPCVDPISAPGQLAGKTIYAAASSVNDAIVEALGATRVYYDSYGADAGACKIHAVLVGFRNAWSLPGTPTYTGDVTVHPKYQVLAANRTAFERLSLEQKAALRAAAEAARDLAIAELQPEPQVAAAYCAGGGRVVLAGQEGIAAFEQATSSVTDRLLEDPEAAAAIEAIRSLKATIEPGPGAPACGPTGGQGTPPYPTLDIAGYNAAIPPDGTYRADITTETMLAAGASIDFARSNAVRATLTLEDGVHGWVVNEEPPCYGDTTSDGTAFQFHERVPDTCIGGSFVWREATEGISLIWLPPPAGTWPVQDVIDVSAFFNRTWIQID